MGLRAQLLLGLLLVVVGAIVSIGAIAIWQTRLALADDRWERVRTLTGATQLLAERSLGDVPSVTAAETRLPALSQELARVVGADEVVFYDEQGKKLSSEQAPDLSSDRIGVGGAVAGVAPHVEVRPNDEDGVRLIAYAPILTKSRITGALRVTFMLDEAVDTMLDRTRTAVIVLGAVEGLLLLAAAAWALHGTVVRPVRELDRMAKRVAGGDLDASVKVRGPGELGQLAESFDRMTESLRTGRESLIRSEKLASVGRLAAGVAHEVGNPLAAILGYVDTLRTSTPEKPIEPALRDEILARVRGETERIDGIVRELLEYARPPTDTGEEVELVRVVEAAVSLAKARSRDVMIQVNVPADVPNVHGTTSRLTQVLINLIFNGADAMNGKGTITIDAAHRGEHVVLGVSDQGPGVPRDLRAKIFDPFFTTKDPGRGTGLGLAVSQSIVESLGGKLALAPSEKGARFEITLDAVRS